jgi:hypothetical protein
MTSTTPPVYDTSTTPNKLLGPTVKSAIFAGSVTPATGSTSTIDTVAEMRHYYTSGVVYYQYQMNWSHSAPGITESGHIWYAPANSYQL